MMDESRTNEGQIDGKQDYETHFEVQNDDQSSDTPSDEISEYSRRNTLKAVGAFAPIFSFNISSPNSIDRTEIVTDRAGNSVLRTEMVPTEWYGNIQTAFSIKESLLNKYKHHLSVATIGVGVASEKIENHRKPIVTVGVPAGKSPPLDLPGKRQNIPINVEEFERPVPYDCDDHYDPVPGGAILANETQQSNVYGFASSTWKVNNGGQVGLMASAHPYYDESKTGTCGGGSLSSQKTWQSGGSLTASREIGPVIDKDYQQDWVILENESGGVTGFDNSVLGESGRIWGRKTKDGVMNLASNDATIYKRGYRTCTTSGQVIQIKSRSVPGCSNDEFVDTTVHSKSGDSGGPVYDIYTDTDGCDWLSVINPIYGGTSTYTTGCAAYEINNKHSITFDVDFNCTCDGFICP